MSKSVAIKDDSLANVGRRLSRRFAAIAAATRPENEVLKNSAVVNEQQRFELWAVNLGLYHGGHSSLDYRFRDSPPLLKYALGLLRDLENELSHLADALKDLSPPNRKSENDSDIVVNSLSSSSDDESEFGDDDSEEEDFSSYQTEPIACIFLKNVVSTIDRLFRLSFKIRNPAMRIGLSKALKYTEKDPDTGIDLIDEYAKIDLQHVEELLRSYRSDIDSKSVSSSLVQRLARGNTRRRQQFGYWRKRKEKHENFTIADQINETPNPISQGQLNVTVALTAPSRPSTATVLNPSKVNLDDDTSIISRVTFIATTDNQDEDQVIIPPPPELDSNVKEFECPYCYTICPRQISGKTGWEQHVFRDLRPYICTYEDCKEPNQQYDSFSDWALHEVTVHHFNDSNNISGSIADFPTRVCPLCFIEGASVSHIASHLRRIACFALPKAMYNDKDSETYNGASDRANIQSFSTNKSNEALSWDDEPGFELNDSPIEPQMTDSYHNQDFEETRKALVCPLCGEDCYDLKAHMETHKLLHERREKCPVLACKYHRMGFARKSDRDRHTLAHYKGTIVCGFCPGAVSPAEKSFRRVDVFESHLVYSHDVFPTPPDIRKRTPITSRQISGTKKTVGHCPTCDSVFDTAQELYDHLGECVLKSMEQELQREGMKAKNLGYWSQDEDSDSSHTPSIFMAEKANDQSSTNTGEDTLSENNKPDDFKQRSPDESNPNPPSRFTVGQQVSVRGAKVKKGGKVVAATVDMIVAEVIFNTDVGSYEYQLRDMSGIMHSVFWREEDLIMQSAGADP